MAMTRRKSVILWQLRHSAIVLLCRLRVHTFAVFLHTARMDRAMQEGTEDRLQEVYRTQESLFWNAFLLVVPGRFRRRRRLFCGWMHSSSNDVGALCQSTNQFGQRNSRA